MIFFFHGSNSYAARQQITKLIDQYQSKTGGDFGIERIDGATASTNKLSSALQASPLLSTSRLVIIEDAGSNKSIEIDRLIADVPPTTVAIFYDTKVDKRSSYYKTLIASANVTTHGFEPLSTAQLIQWIAREAKHQGGGVDRATANYLLDRAGEDQWRLSGEIAKLVAYQGVITRQSIDQMVTPTASDTIFDLVDAMTAGNTAVATQRYRSLLAEQVSEYYILTMIIWQLRNLVLAKAGSNLSSAELAKTAGLSPFVAGKVLAKVKPLNQTRLHAMFSAAVETDYQLKSGLGKPDVLVEKLIVQIAQQVNSR